MSVHDIEPDEQRNTQTRLLDCQALHLVHVTGPDQVEQIADRAGLDRLGRIARDDRPGHRISGGRHGELTELLGQRHLPDQPLDSIHVSAAIRMLAAT